MNVRDPSINVAGFVEAVVGDAPTPPAVSPRPTYRSAVDKAERNEQIKRLRAIGMTLAEIGDVFDLTPGGVHHILTGRRGKCATGKV
jgi:hypothetical protein